MNREEITRVLDIAWTEFHAQAIYGHLLEQEELIDAVMLRLADDESVPCLQGL